MKTVLVTFLIAILSFFVYFSLSETITSEEKEIALLQEELLKKQNTLQSEAEELASVEITLSGVLNENAQLRKEDSIWIEKLTESSEYLQH